MNTLTIQRGQLRKLAWRSWTVHFARWGLCNTPLHTTKLRNQHSLHLYSLMLKFAAPITLLSPKIEEKFQLFVALLPTANEDSEEILFQGWRGFLYWHVFCETAKTSWVYCSCFNNQTTTGLDGSGIYSFGFFGIVHEYPELIPWAEIRSKASAPLLPDFVTEGNLKVSGFLSSLGFSSDFVTWNSWAYWQECQENCGRLEGCARPPVCSVLWKFLWNFCQRPW